MAGRFTVETTLLGMTGARLAELSSTLGSVRGAVGELEAAGAATGQPALEGALGELAHDWSGALTALQHSTESLGGTLGASAGAYEASDRLNPKGG